jgi:hypothetical protein
MKRRNLLAGAVSSALVLPYLPADAQLVNKYAEDLQNGEFNWFPERAPAPGPMLIIVSIPDQKVFVYRNGTRVAASTCSTGKPGHSTPTGVFKVLQKDKHHHSSTYNNASMPNMNRLTWSGIALHAGQLPGYPASHGCVRLPLQFSELLFGVTKLGLTVVIADQHSQPASVVHPGMVLGEYAKHEFLAVESAIKQSDATKHTSVVVSGHSKSITVFENNEIVAEGGVTIADETKPLGEHVYTLTHTDSEKGDLHWSAMSHGVKAEARQSDDLRRIAAAPVVRDELRKRTHHGMTLVTTHQPSTATQRSSDFTIIDGVY